MKYAQIGNKAAFFDGKNYWIQDKRLIIPSKKIIDVDWEEPNEAQIKLFEKRIIPWEVAVAQSPVGRAKRVSSKGTIYIKIDEENTWYLSKNAKNFKKGSWKNTDRTSWTPMTEDDEYATVILKDGYFDTLSEIESEETVSEGTVSEETISVDNGVCIGVGPMATALSHAIKITHEMGEREKTLELVTALSRLVNNASWLLREDRNKY